MPTMVTALVMVQLTIIMQWQILDLVVVVYLHIGHLDLKLTQMVLVVEEDQDLS